MIRLILNVLWLIFGGGLLLAVEYGILSTPTLFLVDPQGKVVSRKLRKAAEADKALEKPLASKPVSANLGTRQ